jgi:hypothetical protein
LWLRYAATTTEFKIDASNASRSARIAVYGEEEVTKSLEPIA